jgi:hypothetical protein
VTPQVHSLEDRAFKAAMSLSDAARDLLTHLGALTPTQLIQWAKEYPVSAESLSHVLRGAEIALGTVVLEVNPKKRRKK